MCVCGTASVNVSECEECVRGVRVRLRERRWESSEREVRATKRSLQAESGRHRTKDMLRSREGSGEAEAPETGGVQGQREWRSTETEEERN